jgi:hypothetical protein
MNTKTIIATAAAVFAVSTFATAASAGGVVCAGANACKGQSACKSAANACKGKGFVETGSTVECTVIKSK